MTQNIKLHSTKKQQDGSRKKEKERVEEQDSIRT